MTEIDEDVQFFDRVFEKRASAREALTAEEFHIYIRQLSLCDIRGATYEIERSRYLQHQRQKPPLGDPSESSVDYHQRVVEYYKQETQLPIDDFLEQWNLLIVEFGGPDETQMLLLQQTCAGRTIR